MSYIDPSKRLKVTMSSLQRIEQNVPTGILENQMSDVLSGKIHGISFSPYKDDQSPVVESKLSKEQIRERMSVIAPYTRWVRSFSCTDGNEHIPEIAKSFGLKTLVGAWIDGDLERNEIEISNLIELAKKGHADIVAIGNEVLLREEMSVQTIIDYMNRVREEVPEVKVTYVDAYYLFAENPDLVEACDVVMANCYPFWEYCNLEYSIDYMRHMYEKTVKAAGEKEVIISETGWPNRGGLLGGAVPSYENAMSYFINTYRWAHESDIKVFYFSSFDEIWKVEKEGECGAYWGIWDKNESYKFGTLG